MSTETTLHKHVATPQGRFNTIVSEYAAAVARGNAAAHAEAAKAVDALALEFAWNSAILDTISDTVDGTPLTLAVTPHDDGVRSERGASGETVWVRHTEKRDDERGPDGVHETAVDALKAWCVEVWQ